MNEHSLLLFHGLTIVWAKVKAVADVPKSLIEGRHVDDALAAGVVKLAASTPATGSVEALKAYLEPLKMKAWAIPVEVALSMSLDKASDAAARALGDRLPQERKAPPLHVLPSTPRQHLMDAVLYDRSVIEKTAVRQIGSASLSRPAAVGLRR